MMQISGMEKFTVKVHKRQSKVHDMVGDGCEVLSAPGTMFYNYSQRSS